MSLEPYLALNRFFLDKLGARSVADLSDWQKVEDKPSPDSHTAFFHRALDVARDDLASRLDDYDRRLRDYEMRLGQARKNFTSFKYFQYLALLASEYHFDRMTRDASAYVDDLNAFLGRQQREGELEEGIEPFTLDDLRRLAFYMATGAGKTLLLHVHVWQIEFYLKHGMDTKALAPKGKLDHFILLASNAGLAAQHREELLKSGIHAKFLADVKQHPESVFPGTVLVVDMPKLRDTRAKDESAAEGVYYPGLGKANLVLADEGHKGTANAESAWRKIRETLAEDGVLIEYSATFAQVLNREKQKREYGKRILADYQYRYFYYDGYGKDFKVLNVNPGLQEIYEDRALAGGLLLFYKQMRLFKQKRERLLPFNVKKPLWVFVGQTVTRTAQKKLGAVEEDTKTLTDVGRVVRFLRIFLESEAWGKEVIHRAIYDSDFLGQGNNPFAPYLTDLQAKDGDALYDDIREVVFGGQGALELRQLPTPGEIGLRLSTSQEGTYFGLINIGDTAGFRKLMDKEGIPIGEDPLLAKETDGGGIESKSLFSDIDEPTSPVNLLIGARKFAEGWSSWRVSSMALLYIGKNQGPLIIQLFGRGVRLLGRGHSLKRSGEDWLEPLETLYIVGLKADYVKSFLSAIDKEDIGEPMKLPVEHHFRKGLPLPRLPEDFDFDKETVLFEVDKAYKPVVDLAPVAHVGRGPNAESRGPHIEKISGGASRPLSQEEIKTLDWPRLMAQLRRYAVACGYRNLVLDSHQFKEVLEKGYYQLKATNEILAGREAIERASLAILQKYVDRLYRAKLNEAQTRNMKRGCLRKEELPRTYIVTVPRRSRFKKEIEKLKKTRASWYKEAPSPIPRLYIDPKLLRLLYQPLPYKRGLDKDVRITPTPLEESEVDFVRALKDFWKTHHDQEGYRDMRLYLMRNASRSGIGFHHKTGFYPDFILWVEHECEWRVVFVEPHGMGYESLKDNPKIEVFTDILPKLNKKPEFQGVTFDGYILTSTHPSLIRGAEDYEGDWDRLAKEKHVLMKERGDEQNMRALLLPDTALKQKNGTS